MTAEIAILNKSAVALAADSAVTILAGTKEEKIFNTADKLFELSDLNPMGIMINNVTNFMETPLAALIKQFRTECPEFRTVSEAAEAFLIFLNKFGIRSHDDTKMGNIKRIINPLLDDIGRKVAIRIQTGIAKGDLSRDNVVDQISIIADEALIVHERVFQKSKKAKFVGKEAFRISADLIASLKETVDKKFSIFDTSQKRRLLKILRQAITGNIMSENHTGIIIAGFGKGELFPTLVSYQIDGIICDRLKFIKTEFVDIDRLGTRAKVLPFAQREMVDRFVYGLDRSSQKAISEFCQATLPHIRERIMESLNITDAEDREYLVSEIRAAEDMFIEGLNDNAYKEIREKSELDIEAMVEFMPKPELAQMAEALVELTSIKRRVSRGMETVGGPIDVAIISQTEGFVWIKRKHYFPRELNARYMARVQSQVDRLEERRDGKSLQFGSTAPNGGEPTKVSEQPES